jgi:hypothetical protein
LKPFTQIRMFSLNTLYSAYSDVSFFNSLVTFPGFPFKHSSELYMWWSYNVLIHSTLTFLVYFFFKISSLTYHCYFIWKLWSIFHCREDNRLLYFFIKLVEYS